MEIREIKLSDELFVDLIGWIDPSMTDEEIVDLIEELEAEEEARIELADMARDGWR